MLRPLQRKLVTLRNEENFDEKETGFEKENAMDLLIMFTLIIVTFILANCSFKIDKS